MWEAGYTAYPVKKYFGDTSIPYDDGQHILYVNAAVDDGTETAKLMQYFKTADPFDRRHGELSNRVHYLKCEEGGYQEMCDVTEKIYKEGKLEGKKESALRMHEKGFPDNTIADLLDVDIELVQEWLYKETTAAS